MKTIIIGAGPSGLMCAGMCSCENNQVIVLDHNEKAGKKLYITGKGRCNVTNNCPPEEFLTNVVSNKKFLYSAIYRFQPKDAINFIEEQGIKLKIERGNRVFPVSDKSSDITKALVSFCNKNGINFIYNQHVVSIEKSNNLFKIKTDNNEYICDNVVIATGGKSYQPTGSTGDGYKLAKNLGHNVIEPLPALCPIILKDKWVKDVEGISLKNVNLFVENNNTKKLYTQFGEMLFTLNGISGPIALTISSYINKLEEINLFIDFKPALTENQLNARLEREIMANENSQISTIIRTLLPKNLVNPFLQVAQISNQLKGNQLNQKEKTIIVNKLKRFPLKYAGLENINRAIITSGGVDTKEINPKTMESKLIDGLYFVGEVIDVDALTGGFNIQIALSTGFVAGEHIKGRSL